jgi:hypothetical protein
VLGTHVEVAEQRMRAVLEYVAQRTARLRGRLSGSPKWCAVGTRRECPRLVPTLSGCHGAFAAIGSSHECLVVPDERVWRPSVKFYRKQGLTGCEQRWLISLKAKEPFLRVAGHRQKTGLIWLKRITSGWFRPAQIGVLTAW